MRSPGEELQALAAVLSYVRSTAKPEGNAVETALRLAHSAATLLAALATEDERARCRLAKEEASARSSSLFERADHREVLEDWERVERHLPASALRSLRGASGGSEAREAHSTEHER
jgi:hypothetical protein